MYTPTEEDVMTNCLATHYIAMDQVKKNNKDWSETDGYLKIIRWVTGDIYGIYSSIQY